MDYVKTSLQVEEFILMPVDEALNTIKTDLARWKPNCALVMIDFALRHGFLDPDHAVRGKTQIPPAAAASPFVAVDYGVHCWVPIGSIEPTHRVLPRVTCIRNIPIFTNIAITVMFVVAPAYVCAGSIEAVHRLSKMVTDIFSPENLWQAVVYVSRGLNIGKATRWLGFFVLSPHNTHK